MEFRILGPLEVRDGEGNRASLQGPRQCALLAVLLLHANEWVSVEQLVDELWSDGKPQTALNALQVHVSHLRKLLGVGPTGSNGRLVTERGGYRLELGPDELDAERFERLVAEARSLVARSRHADASGMFHAAEALWHGPALSDFRAAPFAQAAIARLDELRLAAVEDRVEADLALGRNPELVAELDALVAEHPLREGLRGQLMLALYRGGRQADALEEFQRARKVLIEEVGLEPSTALKSLQASILRQDPALESETPSGQDAPRSTHAERKTLTALFASFALGEDEARLAIDRHGGHVLEIGAEGVLAVFSLPRSREDDALRALRAAGDLRDALDDVRIGVETGTVLVQPSTAREPEIAGDVLSSVERLASRAKLGEIVLGESTRLLAGHALRLKPARRLAGGGPIWRLLELAADAPAIPLNVTTPFVDRERELAQLIQAYERTIAERTSYLVTVLGPAGIGKSRLAAELRRYVAADASVFVGRCLPYGEGITFWPLAEIVEQAAGERAPEALAERLAGDEDAGTIAQRIAGVLGAGEGIAGTDETFWAVRRFLERLARTRPVVVFFEDLHWAEPTFLNLVDHIADWARSAPLLIVCLARPEFLDARPTWGGGKTNAASMLLEPLPDDQSAALVDHLVEAPLEAENRATIVEAAGGNPLFIEELVRVTVERDRVPGIHATPPTIQAVVAARIDQLAPEERDLLGAASIVGKVFQPAALAELADQEWGESLREHLRTLVRKDVIRPHPDALAGEEAFAFRHILIRDAVYTTIPEVRRAELHERFAVWLEGEAGERFTEYEEIVGFHLMEAFRCRRELGAVDDAARILAAKAAGHLVAAARRANAREDSPAEIALLSSAIELLHDDDRERLELLPDLGDALRMRGQFDQARAVLDEATALADDAGDEAIAAYAAVIRVRLDIQTDPAFSLSRGADKAEWAFRVLEESGDDHRLAGAWELLAWLPYLRCRYAEAEEALQKTLEHAERAGNTRQEQRARSLLLSTAVFGPLRVEEGIRRCNQVLAENPASGRITASATRALASLTAMTGDFAEAHALVARDKALSEEVGGPLLSGRASLAYGILELLADDPLAAEAELRIGFEQLSELGEQGTLCTVAAVLAQAVFLLGRDEEALNLSMEAERIAAFDDINTHVLLRGPRAKILAREGRFVEAVNLAAEAVALAETSDYLNMRGDICLDAAEVHRLAGDPEQAKRHLRKAIHVYDRKGNRSAAARARRLLSEVA